MNIPRMYTIALEAFGYTEAEANFLYLVATHSGYFTCQQFVRFTGGKSGKRTISFVRKLLEKGHVSARPCLRNGKVYHLFARNLYEAIGKDNVRFRRTHALEYIRSRLAAFDFVLGRINFRFLGTEAEKVSFFTEQLGIDQKYLPAKRYAGAIRGEFTDRYFVDKFPMFLPRDPSDPPVVSFSFVDPGLESFDSWNLLRKHLKPAAKRLGLPSVTWHLLRHCHATMLDSVRTPLGTIQSLLGHSTPEITREIYLHGIPEEQRRAVESVEELVFGPKWSAPQVQAPRK